MDSLSPQFISCVDILSTKIVLGVKDNAVNVVLSSEIFWKGNNVTHKEFKIRQNYSKLYMRESKVDLKLWDNSWEEVCFSDVQQKYLVCRFK